MFSNWGLVIVIFMGLYWLGDTIANIQKRLSNIEKYISERQPNYDDDE